MIAWLKRYSSISMQEIGEMTAFELNCYKEALEDIIRREGPKF